MSNLNVKPDEFPAKEPYELTLYPDSNAVIKVHRTALGNLLALSLKALRLPFVYRSVAVHAVLPQLIGSLLHLILLLEVALVLHFQHLG